MQQRLIALVTSALLIGGLFVGAPAPAWAAAADSMNVYIGFNAHTAGGSCADPDYRADGIADSTAISDAVNDTASGGTLHFCPGTYDVNATIVITEKDITLQGAGAARTVLDGGATVAADGTWVSGGVRVVTTDSDLTVQKLTIQHAAAQGLMDAGYGGAILITGGKLAIMQCAFRANNARFGGGAIRQEPRHADYEVIIQNSIFDKNHAQAEEGGAASISANVVISRSTFSNNSAGEDGYDGGAIYSGGEVDISSSRFSGNDSGYNGGAVSAQFVSAVSTAFVGNTANSNYGGAIYASSVVVATSTFERNAAAWGGAIHTITGSISSSRFYRNTAADKGGAIIIWDPETDDLGQIRRNTFSRNTSASGGAITLGPPCVVRTRSDVASIERANRFSGNRASEERRTNNIEGSLGCFG